MTLTDWGSWAAIIAGALAVIYALYAVTKYILHKVAFRHPIKATYLIPQAEYPCRQFIGAPQKEFTPKNIVVGIGQYQLMHELSVRANVTTGVLVLSFEGPIQNKPTIEKPDNPFIVETFENMGKNYLKDWWGIISPYSLDVGPSYWFKDNPRVTGYRVTTTGEWKGKACLEIPIQGEKPFVEKLDFAVSETEDQIPFLKVGITLPSASTTKTKSHFKQSQHK